MFWVRSHWEVCEKAVDYLLTQLYTGVGVVQFYFEELDD